MEIEVPQLLEQACRRTAERAAWRAHLPDAIRQLAADWEIELSAPFDDASAAWVAPGVTGRGDRVVLKLGMPHMEAADEIAGLRWWDGDPAVRLLRADDALNAMLLERCVPGSPLRALPEPEQDVIIARLLRRAWRRPPPPATFRPLAEMIGAWAAESEANAERWLDEGLAWEGLAAMRQLVADEVDEVVLVTDLHAGNVLRAQREPWLIIDPKPFVGDPAYDATQHLLNCLGRLRDDPAGTIDLIAGPLEVDADRVRSWTFARLAAEPGRAWTADRVSLARTVAP